MANGDSQRSLELSQGVRSNTLFEEPTINTDSFREKLEKDIAFLRDRIERLQSQCKSNSLSLHTYQHMLDDRLEILARLRSHD